MIRRHHSDSFMLSFISKRLLAAIPLLLAVTLIASVLMTISPGDILTNLRANKEFPPELVVDLEERYGLVDDEGNPTRWYVRYGAWMGGVVQGDFGQSITYRIPVADLLLQRVPATFILSFTSIVFAWMIAIPLGVLAAIKKDSIFDRISSMLAYAALSIPEFYLAIIAVYVAAVTGWLPIGGRSSIGSEFMGPGAQFFDGMYHLILPTIVLGIGSVASLMRVMRAGFIDDMRQQYVMSARAKGMTEMVVMFKHVLRNAVNPLITSMGFAFSSLLSGALLVETVMNYPGLGQLVFRSLLDKDEYVVMAALIVSTLMLVVGNMVADVTLAWSDPRVRKGMEGQSTSFSPIRVVCLSLFVVSLIGIEICIEAFFPQTLPFLIGILKWGAIVSVTFLAIACVGLIIYVSVQLTRRLLLPILQRPIGAISFGTLVILYAFALFADFVAPYAVDTQNLPKAYHPPTAFTYNGGLAVKNYELVDQQTRKYGAVEGESFRVTFLPVVEPYKFCGLFSLNRKLFGLDAEDPTARIYLLGSDTTGRCVFSRLLYGSRISLTIGLIGISITMTLGFIVGGLSGYFGGIFDFIAMRFVELLMSIPTIYLLLALRSALFEPGLSPTQVYIAIIVILSMIGWAGAARVIRGMSLSIRNRPYVQAAESMGQPHWKILYKHILPNLSSYLLVAATLSIPGYILGEAALSFLGLGISEPSASWGLMLKQSQADMTVFFLGFWWLLAPGAAIFTTVIAFNVFGDALRDVVDPKQ